MNFRFKIREYYRLCVFHCLYRSYTRILYVFINSHEHWVFSDTIYPVNKYINTIYWCYTNKSCIARLTYSYFVYEYLNVHLWTKTCSCLLAPYNRTNIYFAGNYIQKVSKGNDNTENRKATPWKTMTMINGWTATTPKSHPI